MCPTCFQAVDAGRGDQIGPQVIGRVVRRLGRYLVLGISLLPGSTALADGVSGVSGVPEGLYDPSARAAMAEVERYLDVTKPPFGADPSGRQDSTAAIRRAIAQAQREVATGRKQRNAIRAAEGRQGGPARNRAHATLYFPAGTYRVSDSLVLADSIEASRYLHVVGQDRARTVIRLDDRAEGFDDPENPKVLVNFLDFWWSNSAFCNSIEGLTIDVGAGNPGAVALRYHNNNIG
ncbi:MAG: glycosyl hydrolase family 28-related protein, partial [Planctomycetota bacterium]